MLDVQLAIAVQAVVWPLFQQLPVESATLIRQKIGAVRCITTKQILLKIWSRINEDDVASAFRQCDFFSGQI